MSQRRGLRVSYDNAIKNMPENWDQVKELFALALERDPEERGNFLRTACGGDDSLRTEIESLLSSFDGAETFLEDCPAAGLLSSQSRVRGGTRIGSYRIVRECGQALANLGENDKAKSACEEARQIYTAAGDRSAWLRPFTTWRRSPSIKGISPQPRSCTGKRSKSCEGLAIRRAKPENS
jgi:tetratricopeptide (TPR) repeat protein